jgi:hypothetical protein
MKPGSDERNLNGQSWSFTNDITDKFMFSIRGDTLTLSSIPGSTKNPANLQKSIAAIRQMH